MVRQSQPTGLKLASEQVQRFHKHILIPDYPWSKNKDLTPESNSGEREASDLHRVMQAGKPYYRAVRSHDWLDMPSTSRFHYL
jgi:hypothetical protein